MTSPRLTGTKTCPKCERNLPVVCFATNRRRSDGLNTYCRECKSKLNQKYRKTPFVIDSESWSF